MHVWNALHAARWKYRTQKWCKKSPSGHITQLCWAISSQLRHILTVGKKLVKQQYVLHMSSLYGKLGPLTAEICWRVWRSPANFNRFCVMASLLLRHCSPEANQTLHDVWPSPGLLYYVYIFGVSCPLTVWENFARCKIHSISKSCILVYWQCYCMALQQRASAKVCSVVQGMELPNFRRGRHLYLAGRPSRWASAHILVTVVI